MFLQCSAQILKTRVHENGLMELVVVGTCNLPATYRHREIGATYPWLGRCDEHVEALSRAHCVIEKI